MPGTFWYFLFKILPAIAALIYTLYIVYVRSNPARLNAKKRKLSKYKDTPYHNVYQGLYGSKYLAAWTLITLSFVLGLIRNLFHVNNSVPSTPVFVLSFFVSVVGLISLLAGSFLLSSLFRKKDFRGHN